MEVVDRNIVRLVSDTVKPLMVWMLSESSGERRQKDGVLPSKKVDSRKRFESLSEAYEDTILETVSWLESFEALREYV